ncbi:MAG: hypothetical protein ACXVBX_15280, partial [Flavisolibacter sp.]
VFSTVQVCFGQAHNYVQTDTTIINRIASLTGRFILQKPLKNDFSLYFDTMDIKELVTTNEFIEMKNKYPFLKKGDFKMDKSTIDTSLWTASDFGGKILVDNNNTGLDYKEILHKYQLKPDKKLRDTIWNYNNDDCFRRKLINKVSKPVFNSARTVCAIEVFDDDICGEGFRETTYLFFKEGTDWILFDLIFRRQAKY